MSTWIYLLIAVVAGTVLPIQAGINSSLSRHLSSSSQAGFISFLGGLLMMTIFCLLTGHFLPSIKTMSHTPPLLMTGGFLGGVMVITSIILAPKIGAVALVSCLVTGQLIFSVMLDHNGWVGFPVHPVNSMRIIGIVLLIIGVFIIQRY